MTERAVTTEADLKGKAFAMDEEVAEELANDPEMHRLNRQAERSVTLNFDPQSLSPEGTITFYRRNGRRAQINCGTDPDTQRRLKAYYLSKRVVHRDENGNVVRERCFFAQRPPGTEPEIRWRCFVPRGDGSVCNKGLSSAGQFLGHLMGYHRDESINRYPKVIARIQEEVQKELEPGVLKQLGLDFEPEPFETNVEPAPSIFWCRDRFPDCERFFDKEQARRMHWNRDHKEVVRGEAG